MLLPVHNLRTWFIADLLTSKIVTKWATPLMESLTMMHPNNIRLLLVLQALFVDNHMVVIRLVMLFAFNMMMVVLGISNCPYLRSRVIVDRKIIWSGRCAWIRFLHPIITVRSGDFNLLQLNSPVMC